jgi:hypothetical protein
MQNACVQRINCAGRHALHSAHENVGGVNTVLMRPGRQTAPPDLSTNARRLVIIFPGLFRQRAETA